MTVLPNSLKVLVLGDTCIDNFIYCQQNRLNPESGAPLVNIVEKKYHTKGMADNVAKCLISLGFNTDIITGKVGYSIKTRYIDIRTKQQYLRVDEETPFTAINVPDLSKYDAVVVSDYCKGSIGYDTLTSILNKAKCPVFIDTKKKTISVINIHSPNVYLKINEHEAKAADALPYKTIITLGARGAKQGSMELPALKTDVVDVCGAGDAFLAGYIYGCFFGIGNPLQYGIVNSGISVRHVGPYNPTLKELLNGLKEYESQNK